MHPPIHRGARHRRHMQLARAELAISLGALVDTLTQAHALAMGGSSSENIAPLLARARHELDLADEKLLALDRHRQRSYFRQAGRIRSRITRLERSFAVDAR